MSAVFGARSSWWEQFTWRRPAWWAVVLGAIAWLMLVLPIGGGPANAGQGLHHHDHVAMTSSSPATRLPTWTWDALTWQLMVVAMMLPLVFGTLHTTAIRSLWPRRHRAMGGFLLGYLGVWFLLGAAVSILLAPLAPGDWQLRPASAVVGLAIAAVWQLTPAKARALRACHRTVPLAPSGWKADRQCLGYGWMIGGRCVVSCAAMMAACVLAGHSILVMAGVTLIGMTERYARRPNQRISCAALIGLALFSAVRLGR